MNGHENGVGWEYIRSDLSNYGQASNLRMNEHIKELISQGEQIYHLAFGQSPFPLPEKLQAGLVNNAWRNDYVSMLGVKPLRDAIAEFHRRFPTGIPDITLQADNIVVGDGSKMIIYLILMVTDTVLLLKNPTWTTYKPQGEIAGCKNTVQIDSSFDNQWKITPTALEKAILESNIEKEKMILIFTNPCNPTGVVYNDEELEALGEVMRKYSLIVISDEIYGHLTFKGNFTSISKYYPERTIVTTGLSKWASAGGWRVGYALFPPQLSAIRDTISSASSHTYSCCAAPQQYAAVEFLEDEEACRDFMVHTRRILDAVNKMCVRKLQAIEIKVHEAAAGYYIFPDFSVLREKLAEKGVTTGQQLCDLILEQARVSLLPGAVVHLSAPEDFTTRLCFVNFDGGKALIASRELGLSKSLPEQFVTEYCPHTVAAIQALVDWSRGILNS